MVIRRIDDLGRLQLPKDYRKALDIHEGDELVIELKDGYMSVKKEEKKIGEEGMELTNEQLLKVKENQKLFDVWSKTSSTKSLIDDLLDTIQTLTSDKDEQAGKLMRYEAGLKKLRSSFQWLSESIRDLDYKAWAKDKIEDIDALINPVCNTTKLECCRCNPGDCEHRREPRREKQE